MIVALGLIAVIVFGVLAVLRPRWLLLAYIVSLGWIPKETGRDLFGRVDLDDMLLFSVGLLTVPVLIRKGRLRLGRMGTFAVLYWAVSFIANLISYCSHPDIGFLIINQMLKDAALTVFLVTLEAELADKRFAKEVAFALCTAAVGVTVTTLIDFLLPASPIRRLWEWGEVWYRRYGGTAGQSFIAGAYIMGLFGTLVALLVCKARGSLKTIALIGMPFVVLAAVAGQSRSTYVGFAVIVLAAMLKPRQALIAAPAVLIGSVIIIWHPAISERVITRMGRTTAELGHRPRIWMSYVEKAPPIVYFIGEGFTTAVTREWPGHSSYMEVFSDTGIPGLALFISLWYHILTAPRRIRQVARSPTELAVGRAAVWVSVALLISSGAIGLIVNMTYRLAVMCWLAVALAPAWEVRAQRTVLPTYARKYLATLQAQHRAAGAGQVETGR